MIQIFDNKYTKDMALEELIKWIQKHFDIEVDDHNLKFYLAPMYGGQ